MHLSNWKHWAVGSVAALTLIAGNVWMADNVSAESSPQSAAAQETAQPEDAKEPCTVPFGEWRDMHQEYLADAMGISVEELEAAQETARENASEDAKTAAAERLAQAVEDGKLTQEQADSMLERLENADMPRFGGQFMGALDQGSYLADALGISVDELQSAQDEAFKAGMAQAVEDGKLTQEQADDILGLGDLRDYLSEELDGVLTGAIQQAVEEGIITQEQADRYLERLDGFVGRDGMRLPFTGPAMGMGEFRDGFGRDFRMMPGNEGMWRDAPDGSFDHHGMRPGDRGPKPGATDDDSDNRLPRRPGRGPGGNESTPDETESPKGSSITVPQNVPGTLL